jgi:hypothetical protein
MSQVRSRSAHRRIRFPALIALALLASARAWAQPVGTAFAFQGELRSAGTPVAGAADFQFRLFDASTGGAQQGPQLAASNLALAAGRFTVDLDFGAVFAGSTRYLEIDVRSPAGSGAFTTLAPRQPLTADPYSAFALNAAAAANATNLNGQAPSFYTNAANLTGILADARLSSNVPRLNATQSFSGATTFSNASSSFAGSGAGLTALNASNLGSGTLPDARLSANVPLLNASNVFTGNSNTVSGSGSGSLPVLSVSGGSATSNAFEVDGGPDAAVVIRSGTSDNPNASGAPCILESGAGFTGSSATSAGGGILLNAGNGGFSQSAASHVGGAGGPVEIVAGNGGSSSVVGGAGGDIILTPGAAGSGTLSNGTPGHVGIGTATPAALLHVADGSAGVAPNANSTLVVERSTSAFINILTPASVQSGLLFGTPTNNSDAGVVYNTGGSRGFQFRTGGNTSHMTLDATGNLSVTGTLSKGGGSFKIDHPLDPENKYLYHSFVESPDMKNIYDGVVTTDGAGNACIDLPDWFQALNRDCRYQLTVIDPGVFALARVTREVANNRFCIATNLPNIKVSWQVTGIRQDPFANANRIPVEQDKPAALRGTYLHPDAWDKPASRAESAAAADRAAPATNPSPTAR